MAGTLSIAGQRDNLWFIHDTENHLDMDFMTYCIYILAKKDLNSLNNETVFNTLINQVFQTFFQHFVSTNASLTAPSWAYQPIGAQPEDLGTRIIYNLTSGRMEKGNPVTYPTLQTNRTTEATIEHQVEVLKLNAVATWLSIANLIWLIITALIFLVMQRSFLRPLHRNVECIADAMVLFAGSQRLLAFVQKSEMEDLRGDGDTKVKLGWFKTKEGIVRWGIELVEDGLDGVEWLHHDQLP